MYQNAYFMQQVPQPVQQHSRVLYHPVNNVVIQQKFAPIASQPLYRITPTFPVYSHYKQQPRPPSIQLGPGFKTPSSTATILSTQTKSPSRLTPSTKTNYKEYFQNPDLRKIKVIGKSRLASSQNETTADRSRISQSSSIEIQAPLLRQPAFSLVPTSLEWHKIKPKAQKNKHDFSRVLLSCRVQAPKQTCFCEDAAPCKWTLTWTRWRTHPNSKIYHNILRQPASQQTRIQIAKDIPRTQPNHPQFAPALPMLQEILLSYSKYDRVVDYVQGMNLIASVLLYHIKDSQTSFWVLVDLMELKQFRDIYLEDFKKLKLHIKVFVNLVKYYIADLYQHFRSLEVELQFLCNGWFLSLLCNVVPLNTAHLVIDGFLRQGWLGFYKIGLAYLIYLKEELLHFYDGTEVLVRLSSTSPQENTDWQAILTSISKIDLDVTQIYRIP